MRSLNVIRAALLAVVMLSSTPLAHGQIYKWVDDEGNIHYGDKPRETEQATGAQEVEIRESYRPSAATAASSQSGLPSEDDLRRTQEIRREEERARREEEKLARRQARESQKQRCTEMAMQYSRLTGIQTGDGRPTLYFLTHDDGRSYTESEQRAYTEALREKAEAAGCSDFWSDTEE